MTDKIQKIREKVERLKSQLLRGACSSQVAMETRCKEEAYNEVLGILDTMQEEQVSEDLDLGCGVIWKEEPVSEELEKEIQDYYNSRREYRGRYNAVIPVYKHQLIDIARHFANWQKEQFEKNRLKHCDSITNEQAELEQGFIGQHLDKYNRMSTYLDAIEYGMRLQKEQMIANAVSGTTKFVGEGAEKMVKFVCANLNPDEYGLNQRVKLIIIKED